MVCSINLLFSNLKSLSAIGLFIALSLASNTAFSLTLNCGDGQPPCTLQQVANYLDRIKASLEKPDYIYDQIYADGDATLVFKQRILYTMNATQRKRVKAMGANKQSVLPVLCIDERLVAILNQGVILHFDIREKNRSLINEYSVSASDCLN